jgi:hypothetical protein
MDVRIVQAGVMSYARNCSLKGLFTILNRTTEKKGIVSSPQKSAVLISISRSQTLVTVSLD